MTFKLIKTYHKPYRIFHDPYVINIGNLYPAVRNDDNIKWLTDNMDVCPTVEPTPFNMGNSEWSVWESFIKTYDVDSSSDRHLMSFQHYSKVLDLNTIRDTPYNEYTQTEDSRGELYRNATTLDVFGYDRMIDELFEKYDVIVGNQYPCNIITSIRSNMLIEYSEVAAQYLNILYNYGDPLFTVQRFIEYCKQPYQYWRGGPLIDDCSTFRRLFDFTLRFEHSFLDSKRFSDDSIYRLKDKRGNSYIGEMIIGFAIYCYIDECKRLGKRIGYGQMHTDAQVIYGNTKL